MDTYQKTMNEKLRLHYGCDIDSHPRFRFVFSDDLLEKRDHDGEIRELPKYSYIEGRWLIEIHSMGTSPTDVYQWDHYEPLWMYTVNKGEYYKPKWEDLQFIIKTFVEQIVKPVKKNIHMVEAAEEADKEKEINKIFDQLQQSNTFLQQQLKEGEAVSFANTVRFKGNNDD